MEFYLHPPPIPPCGENNTSEKISLHPYAQSEQDP